MNLFVLVSVEGSKISIGNLIQDNSKHVKSTYKRGEEAETSHTSY